MAEVLQPPTPTFFSRGGTSIRSFKFRDRMTSSSPPSIAGDSTKRKAFGMSSLLGRRTKNEPPPDLDALMINEKLLAAAPRATENMDPGTRSRNPSRRVTEPAPSATADKQPPAKSRTIFRKITTKFNRNRSRSTSPPANNRRLSVAPQINNNAAAREARNAALRERGLLPPLPLSVQEQQQDMRIAIVASPEPGEQSGLERRPTAANRIKEEWEAKNRERLTGFRFGGNSPATSPMQENFGLDAVTEVDTPLPSPGLPTELLGDEPEPKIPRAPPPTLNLGRGHLLSPPLMQAWSDIPPDPYMLPLPASPSPESATESNYSSLISAFAATPLADAQFTPLSPSFLPLPPSPSPSNGTFLKAQQSGSETPGVHDEAGDCTPRMPSSPTAASMAESFLAPTTRSQSIPRLDGSSESESSLCVPSLMLDSESQTTVSTAESSASVGRMRNVPLATKVRHSTIEPTGAGHHAISVIVESPSEERDAFLSTSPVDADDEVSGHALPAPAPAPSKAPQRRVTDPAPPPSERRKSLNVFKRGKGEGGLSTMMSIRRSMGLGRAKSSVGAPAGFDPSHLPPSPTLPTEFGELQQQQPMARGRTVAVGAGHAHRLSVSPTMHNRGSILMEMNKIEDEESRRMTEVAFM